MKNFLLHLAVFVLFLAPGVSFADTLISEQKIKNQSLNRLCTYQKPDGTVYQKVVTGRCPR